jgi:ketosteroid isomerase-like protein
MRIALVALVAVITTTSLAVAEPTALRREIEAQNVAMTTAFNRGDLAAVAKLYADDARIMGPGDPPVRGRKAIDAYWTQLKQPRSWKLVVLEVGGSADEPWQLGRSTLVTGAAGQERTSIVDFIVLWRRGPGGKLRIYVDMYVPGPKP